jgi:hypothetical protein
MKTLNKVKIAYLLCLLLWGVFGTLANYSACRVTIVRPLSDTQVPINSSVMNNTVEQSKGNGTQIIRNQDGSRTIILFSVGVGLAEGLSSGSETHSYLVTYESSLTLMENLFDSLRDICEMLSYTLLCVFCAIFVLELGKGAIPRWFPLINC